MGLMNNKDILKIEKFINVRNFSKSLEVVVCFEGVAFLRSNMFRWIMHNPLKSAGSVLVGVPVVNFYLKRKAKKELHTPVLKKLMSGSKPSIPLKETMIPRPTIAVDISRMFLPEPTGETELARFGVVIGPSGSGKTSAI